MEWEVEITGDAADLRMLSEAMCGADTSICERDGSFVLRSTQFGSLQDANDVRAHAQEIVTSLSGSSRLILIAHEPIKVGPVFSVGDDGTKNVFVQLETAVLRVRGCLASVSVTWANGTVEHHRPADPMRDWLEVAAQDPAVAKALRLRRDGARLWSQRERAAGADIALPIAGRGLAHQPPPHSHPPATRLCLLTPASPGE